MFLKLLATGTFTLLVACCYGVMYGIPGSLRSGTVRARTQSGDPVPGLSVRFLTGYAGYADSWYESRTGTTDAAGACAYDVMVMDGESLKASLSDVDGPANGGTFADEELIVDEADEIVTMDPAGS